MIRLEGVALAAGGDVLAADIDLHLRPGDRVGLVGRNGTGKSTLLRAIVGEQPPYEGKVLQRGGLQIGWMPQHAVSGSTRSVWDEAASAMTTLNALNDALSAAEDACARQEPGAPEALADATERFRVAGGYTRDERIGEVLRGLGFGPDTWVKACDTFSGGWQMRIALARLLLSDPDIALLDEPTNHLDLHARQWLAGHLARAPFALLVVSHDRHLLTAVTTRMAELHHGKLDVYNLPYERFLAEREQRRAHQASAHARQQDEIARLERFVERFGAKATKAAQAKSKQKALDRIERIDAPETEQGKAKIRLPPAPAAAHEAVALLNATLGWPDGPQVLTELTVVLERGMRLAVLGPNGIGKSTLLHALAGRLPLRAGTRRVGDRVRIGVFTQDLAAELPPDQTALQLVEEVVPLEAPQKLRTLLGALGLSGDDAMRPTGQLSGGERARVALARLCARAHDVLLLDEPSNHLDAATVEVLADALSAFDGALLLVSHDRWLVERVATHVLHVKEGLGHFKIGVDASDFDPTAARIGGESVSTRAAALSHAERKRLQRERDRCAKRITEIERTIDANDASRKALDDALVQAGDDWARAAAIADEQAALEATNDGLIAEWESLEGEVAGLDEALSA